MASGIWLMRYGQYDLSGIIADYTDSTLSASDSISTFAGVDGGLDNYGSVRVKPPATITASIILVGTSPLDLQLKLDTLDKVLGQGRQRLWYAPNGVLSKNLWRWTWAKASKADRPHNVTDQLVARRTITFSLTDPFWYNNPNIWYFDDGNFFDTGLLFGGAAAAAINNGTNISITNEGDAPALPVLTIVAGGGSIVNFGINHLDAALNILETWSYNNTLPAGAKLIIDCAGYKVLYDGPEQAGSGYAAFVPGTGQRAWMSLLPGVNTLQLFGTFGAAGTLAVDFYHTWH